MIDRAINLLVLGVFLAALASLGFGLHRAWVSTDAWDKEWAAKNDEELPYSAEEVLNAMRKANSAGASKDVAKLRQYLEEHFRPTGNVSVRFTVMEIWESVLFLLIPTVLLVIPMSINYVRHGKFRIWNGDT
jgi:hypothetical protein